MRVLLFYGLWLFLLVFAGRTLLGPDGFLDYQALLEQHRALIQEKEALERENRDLVRRVWRLQEDWVYIEAVAREQLSMVPPNALIYRFDEAQVSP